MKLMITSLLAASSHNHRQRKQHKLVTRETFIKAVLISTLPLTTVSKAAQGACLAGDTNVDCIGVYKVPIDEAVLPYIGTEEALKRYAPDLRYVKPVEFPPNYTTAVHELFDLKRLLLEEVESLTLAGNLVEAGQSLLAIFPRIVVCQKVIMNTLHSSNTLDNKDTMLVVVEEQFSQLIGTLGQCDVTIGQGLRGEMGVLTVQQLAVLEYIREGVALLESLLKILPDKMVK